MISLITICDATPYMRAAIAKPVIKRNFGYIVRKGRGYSIEELKEAGLDRMAAQNAGVPVDVWRKTKLAENVEQLKPIAKAIKESPKKPAKKAAKKTKKKEES
jgi:ribosomal protein L13E